MFVSLLHPIRGSGAGWADAIKATFTNCAKFARGASKFLRGHVLHVRERQATPTRTSIQVPAGRLPPKTDFTIFTFWRPLGCLQYLTQWTRPDLGHATHELSKHQSNPGTVHLDAAKRVVRYLKGTINYGLVYRRVSHDADRLIGFADADWAGDTDTRRSLSANVFLCNGGPILWHCKQQQGVATSTSEAEFVAASTAGKDAEWFQRIMAGMGMHQPGPTPIYEDNKGCRLMSENPVQKSKTRHIDVAQHKVRLLVRQNVVRLIDCPTEDMAADILTKALPAPSFQRHRDTILGYMPHSAPSIPSILPPWKGY